VRAGSRPPAVGEEAAACDHERQGKSRSCASKSGHPPCLAATTLKLKWVIDNAPAGATVVVKLTGPGLPPQITFQLRPDGSYEQDYTVQGSGKWTSDVVTINGAPAPTLHSQNSASAACS
jgi:hypothetical protein